MATTKGGIPGPNVPLSKDDVLAAQHPLTEEALAQMGQLPWSPHRLPAPVYVSQALQLKALDVVVSTADLIVQRFGNDAYKAWGYAENAGQLLVFVCKGLPIEDAEERLAAPANAASSRLAVLEARVAALEAKG